MSHKTYTTPTTPPPQGAPAPGGPKLKGRRGVPAAQAPLPNPTAEAAAYRAASGRAEVQAAAKAGKAAAKAGKASAPPKRTRPAAAAVRVQPSATAPTRLDPDQDWKQRQQFDRQSDARVHAPVIGGKTVRPPAKTPDHRYQRTAEAAARPVLRPRLAEYVRMLADPMNSEPVKCPVNYNPVPSQLTSVASTPVQELSINVAATTCTEILIFPGHGIESDLEAMDGESYHAVVQTVNATNYTIGPVANAALGNVLGCYTPNLGIGAATTATTGAGAVAITPSVALPYQASASDGSHTRWKLNAAGVEIQNTTAEGSRAGSIASVQTNTMGPPTAVQAAYSTQPTFKVSQEANTGTFKQNWLPRAVDQAFWHTATAGAGVATTAAVGTWKIWLNNPSAVTQNYVVSFNFHWELGGSNLLALATPAVLQPADVDVLEPAFEVMRFGGSDTQHAYDITSAVAEGASPFVEAVPKFASKAARWLAGSVLEGVEGLFAEGV